MESVELDDFRTQLLRELDAVHRMAYHLTYSVDQAEDLVQETYLRALKSRGTFRATERGPRPWLFKILHNVHRTRMGKKVRENADSESLDFHPAPVPEPLPDRVDWEQVDQRLKAAIEALSVPLRTVVLLWAVEGLTYQQMADVTDVPIGTVMSRLYRARRSLAEQVADLAAELRIAPRDPARRAQAPMPADEDFGSQRNEVST